MSVSKALYKDQAPAGVDLSTSLFRFVSLNSAGKLVLPAAGAPVYGVVVDPDTIDRPVTVDVLGIVKVQAGGTVATGALVAATAAGKALTATAGQNVAGIARKGGALDTIIEVMLVPQYIAV